MTDVLREVVLIAATMAMGLMAEVFGMYGNAIMPGLRRTDDRTFVAAFQSIDRAIINPAFMATFFGALAVTALAALLHLTADGRPMLPWIVAALVSRPLRLRDHHRGQRAAQQRDQGRR
jgi:uncharacterized membrane protein